nr:MAG TPA: hypothetical protein [Caudoviricetes sp.]
MKYRERAFAVRTWKSHGLPIECNSQVFHSIQAKSVIFDRRPPQGGNCTLTTVTYISRNFPVKVVSLTPSG